VVVKVVGVGQMDPRRTSGNKVADESFIISGAEATHP
jgi:hypothetical protein